MSKFEKNIKEVFRKHDVDNSALESALIDIFRQHEREILSKDFVEKIFKIKKEIDDRKKRAWGG